MKLFNNSALFSLLVVAFLCVMQTSAVETEVERLLKGHGGGGMKGGCGKIKDSTRCLAQLECKWCDCEAEDYECPESKNNKHAAGGKCIDVNDGCED